PVQSDLGYKGWAVSRRTQVAELRAEVLVSGTLVGPASDNLVGHRLALPLLAQALKLRRTVRDNNHDVVATGLSLTGDLVGEGPHEEDSGNSGSGDDDLLHLFSVPSGSDRVSTREVVSAHSS